MTKRAIIVGLIMAAVALLIIFIRYSPEKTTGPSINDQEIPPAQDYSNPDSSSDSSSNSSLESSADLEAELNSIGNDLNGVDTELDTSGL